MLRLLPLALLLAAAPGCRAHDAGAAAAQRAGGGTEKAEDAPALPRLTGRVVDGAGLMDAATEAKLSATLSALERRTSDQLVVVTVPNLGGEAIETFGLRLGNSWGVGQKGLDNGVLLIVAPQDRRVRIEVGRGLEGLLTDARARQIIEESLVPRFRQGGFDEGIETGVESISETLLSDTRRPQPRKGRS